MQINVVCTDHGWIYSQFIDQFKKHSKHTILLNAKKDYDVVHWLPYYEYREDTVPSTCWLSHQEKKQPLNNKFVAVAKEVDVGLSHSRKYATMLRDNHNLDNIMSIIPGIDLEKFKLRSSRRSNKTNKLIVGYIGRQYTSSNRKNPQLLDKINKLPFIEFRTTGGKVATGKIPKFYSGLDLIVSPAIIEGGPMCVQEGLAVGVPILCMENVGVTNEFGEGVIKAKDNDDFVTKLKQIYDNKEYINKWRSPSYTSKLRKQIEKQTWEKFVHEHDKVWEMITTKSWRETNG